MEITCDGLLRDLQVIRILVLNFLFRVGRNRILKKELIKIFLFLVNWAFFGYARIRRIDVSENGT